MLAVDTRGDFVLLALERVGDEELLRRIRTHHAWVTRQVPFLRKLYGAGPVSPFHTPRVIALSEEFSEQFLVASRELNVPLTLFHYRILVSGARPMLYLELTQDEAATAAQPAESESDLFSLEPDPLTPEEWEEFYGFERRRLAAEGVSAGVKR